MAYRTDYSSSLETYGSVFMLAVGSQSSPEADCRTKHRLKVAVGVWGSCEMVAILQGSEPGSRGTRAFEAVTRQRD
jgi:hypothetical protein